MYALVLGLHSCVRWLVLASLCAAWGRALAGLSSRRDFGRSDRRALSLFIGALDIQASLGLLLYFVLSPLTPKSLVDLRMQMPIAPLRFFAIEHITAMLLAFCVAHITLFGVRRARAGRSPLRRAALGLSVSLLLIAAAIPWPGTPYARPLLRSLPNGAALGG